MSDIPENDFNEIYTDPIDQAGQLSEMLLQKQLAEQREAQKNAVKLIPTGECQDEDCTLPFEDNDPLKNEKLFCDSKCAENWAHKRRLKGLPT